MQLRERLQAAGIDYRPTRPVGRVLPRSGLYALTFLLLRLVKDEIVELVTPKSRLHNLHMEYTRFTGGKWALEPGFWVTGSPIWSGRVNGQGSKFDPVPTMRRTAVIQLFHNNNNNNRCTYNAHIVEP